MTRTPRYIYNNTIIYYSEEFTFFKKLYINHAKTHTPAWKIFLYRTTGVMPKFFKWVNLINELNILKTQPEFHKVLKYFHEQQNLNPTNEHTDNIIEILKTNPELTEALFNGIHNHDKMSQYELTLQILLTQTEITDTAQLILLTALEVKAEQANEYLKLTTTHLKALL